ncbi:MAG: sensor histidine kinase [Aggregatilineales bacterium]
MTVNQTSTSNTDIDSAELLEHYKRIIEISYQLSSTYDYTALLRKIVNAARELIHSEAASIILVDEATGQLRFALASNIKPHEMEEIIIPMEGSIAGWIVTHGEPRVIERMESASERYEGVDEKIGFHSRNLLGVPMKTHTRVVGVMQAVNKLNGEPFTDQDIITLRTLAGQAGMAIENARLFQQSDFIAEMVHELRTPLMALKASTTLLRRPKLPEDKRGDIVDTMHHETERLINLTNDFLDVARLESGRTQLSVSPFEMRKLLTESADVVAQQAKDKNITIRVQKDEYIVEADRGKVKQVLLNLLTNAIKYNRPNGNIDILTQKVDQEGHPFVQVSVRDTGYGISREHQKHMFQKFYRVPTTENVARGTGLGLTICKHIIEAHGGRIWLQSEENVGSVFSFTLPEEFIEDDD